MADNKHKLSEICPQLPKEPAHAYAAFGAYALLGEKRSVAKLVEYYTVNKILPKPPHRRTFDTYSQKFAWVARCKEWDRYVLANLYVISNRERAEVREEIHQNALRFYRMLTPKIEQLITIIQPIDRDISLPDGSVVRVPATSPMALKSTVEAVKMHCDLGDYAIGDKRLAESMRTVDALTHLVEQGIAPPEQIEALQAGLVTVVEDVKNAAKPS